MRREFARKTDVVLLDLDGGRVKAAAAELSGEFGAPRLPHERLRRVQAAVDAAVAAFGRVDV